MFRGFSSPVVSESDYRFAETVFCGFFAYSYSLRCAETAESSGTQEQQTRTLTALTIIRFFPVCGAPVCRLLIHSSYRNQPRSQTLQREVMIVCVFTFAGFFPLTSAAYFYMRSCGKRPQGVWNAADFKSAASGVLFIGPQCFEKFKTSVYHKSDE